MIGAFIDIEAEPFAQLPRHFYHHGEPNAWVRATRPGQRLHSFLEGPWFDAAGDLWLADVPYGRVFRVDPRGGFHLAHTYDGEPHGLTGDGAGGLLIADYRRGLLRLDIASDQLETVCARSNTEPFRGLGDVARAPNGDIWLTDPGRSSLSDPTGRLFRLRPGASQPDLILCNIPYPNSIAFSPDGSLAYLSVTRANAVWRLLADAPDPGWPMVGTWLQLSGGLGPDGLAVDSRGRLALAQAQAGRAWIFNALGDPLARIRTPHGAWTTAVRFSPDETSLFIVEAQTATVYRADLSAVI